MRTTLFCAALLWAGLSQASPVLPSDAPTLQVAQAGGSKPSTDDDEDEVPAATPTSKPVSGDPKPADKKDAPAATTPVTSTTPVVKDAPKATGAVAPDDARQTTLVSGAPLYNPNVAVHIVEQKQVSDSGKREVVIYPAAMQVNGKFTQHFGTMGSFIWHLQENFGLHITGGYNWYNSESDFNGELVEKVRSEAQAATSLLWVWGVLAGAEVTPLYGKFALFEGTLARFSVVLSGGAGAGGTRHQLKADSVRQDGTFSPATFGDTGTRFMGELGAGLRLLLGERFALRVEVRDVVYTARVEKLNGCDVSDLRAMDAALKAGKDLSTVSVSGGCALDRFTGTDANTQYKRSNDVPLALNLVKTPSSDVLNNVGLYIGASFIF